MQTLQRQKMVTVRCLQQSFRAFSAKKFLSVLPGPMAQAFAFRAFGAESRSFHALWVAGGSGALRTIIILD